MQLEQASTRALKLLNNYSDLRISFDQQHKLQGRATPNEIMKYKLSIQLYKLYNGTQHNADWIDLNFQQNFNNRQKYVLINDESSLRIGKNLLMNRLGVLNNLIEYDWLNQSLNTFKLKSKKLFLTSWTWIFEWYWNDMTINNACLTNFQQCKILFYDGNNFLKKIIIIIIIIILSNVVFKKMFRLFAWKVWQKIKRAI